MALTQKCEGIELKDGQISDHRCPLEVVLPPERVDGCERLLTKINDKKRLIFVITVLLDVCSLGDVECNVSVGEDNRHEWVFTLYDFDNSGKVTKEDMSSLMQSIYEVVDSSVNQSCNSKRKTLRVKLSVTPEPAARRKDGKHPATERDARLSRIEPSHQDDRQPSHIRLCSLMGQSCEPQDRNHYCVDENTERRNHYLDLAGIENYTSRFDSKRCTFYSNITEPAQTSRGKQSQNRSRSHEPEAHVHRRRSQVIPDHCVPLDPRVRGPQFIKPPKGTYRGAGSNQAVMGGGGKTNNTLFNTATGHKGHSVSSWPHQRKPQTKRKVEHKKRYFEKCLDERVRRPGVSYRPAISFSSFTRRVRESEL
ncbi:Protein naked cuticle -like protein 2 [Triplophysa tibetana]|uniref:Protein naked cuticle homolog n=1 Tax=Triplophysa tibetana TaxID=1572043 RepID=A0A5A9MXZ4_9TELE|nr:Protein naked cuticle -like protein 2 [Triplophysa tibetana]